MQGSSPYLVKNSTTEDGILPLWHFCSIASLWLSCCLVLVKPVMLLFMLSSFSLLYFKLLCSISKLLCSIFKVVCLIPSTCWSSSTNFVWLASTRAFWHSASYHLYEYLHSSWLAQSQTLWCPWPEVSAPWLRPDTTRRYQTIHIFNFESFISAHWQSI